MQLTDALSLVPLASTSSARARLQLTAAGLGTVVPGVRLEQQFVCEPGYLVLTSDDCPFEETLHILLFDRALRVLDSLQMGQPYTGAMLAGLNSTGQRELQFSFFGAERWHLRVLPHPRRFGARPAAPARRTSPPWRPRWLELSCQASGR